MQRVTACVFGTIVQYLLPRPWPHFLRVICDTCTLSKFVSDTAELHIYRNATRLKLLLFNVEVLSCGTSTKMRKDQPDANPR